MSDDQPKQDASQDDPAGIRKALEKANAELAELRQQTAKYQRNEVFDQAGVPRDGAAKWFRNGYDGELTVEAIKAAAEADGLLSTPKSPPPPEAEVHQRIDEATSSPPPTDPDYEALMRDAVAKGGKDGLVALLASRGDLATD